MIIKHCGVAAVAQGNAKLGRAHKVRNRCTHHGVSTKALVGGAQVRFSTTHVRHVALARGSEHPAINSFIIAFMFLHRNFMM